jgi:uncharacterized repeat protein (TIGR01451 family)
MKLKFTKQFVAIVACLLGVSAAFSQQRTPLDIATEHVRTHFKEWGLTERDITGMSVSDQYTDPTTGISRVFFNQAHMGVILYNAITNVSITSDGKVFHVGRRFVPDMASRINTTAPVLSAEAAVIKLMEHLELPYEPLRAKGQDAKGFLVFDKGNIAKEDIKARLSYQLYGDAVMLAWDVALAPVKSADMWSIRVDAVNGSILDKTNWTVYCQVDGRSFAHNHDHCEAAHHHQHETKNTTASLNMAASGSYNIWPWPAESPIHGNRQIVVEPHDVTASPFGWHDINGQAGAEYTITRGNNVHAYEDSDADDQSADNEPDGGASLIFDFPYDANAEPTTYVDASTVNLFYWNNLMHDFAYQYGLTPAAGSFQTNNYGGGGAGGDEVHAEAQDGGGTNNANFATPPDGGNGRMQMFLWDGAEPSEIFTVQEPAVVAGQYESAQPAANWGAGAYASATGVSAEVVIVQDEAAEDLFSDACNPIVNTAELVGKIALIDRGGCEFGFKALAAQNVGAVGVIICNFESAPAGMGPGAVGGQVNIPVISLGSTNCQTLRQFAGNGLKATIKLPNAPTGPSQIDGDLDNGVIAHEYGHGISNRLTGGPSAAGCLSNQEQMGEGWSDFMSLITSAKPGDNGEQARGIGNYADGLAPDAGGIRHYPYTRDMTINPLTYGDIPNETIPHGVGAFWCAILWDLYWNLSDLEGWDPDIFYGTGGNNKAIRLVFEGMKIQPCSPGFIDGRDAIIAADQALNGGANKCLIWKTFARRGVGLSASQGSSDAVGDEVEAFDVPCECRDEVTVTKAVTPFIEAGDEIEVEMTIENCKTTTRTGVVITDELPDGTQYKAGSANFPATVAGNVLTIEIGDVAFDQVVNVTYQLTTDPDKFSISFWLDDVPNDEEETEDNWIYDTDINAATLNLFAIQDAVSNSPAYAWAAPSLETESRTTLELAEPWEVVGNRPTLRFYHRYETQPGVDAGFIEVKKATDNTYTKVGDKMLRNGYTGGVQYGEAFVIPNLQGWSGSSNGNFVATYVDVKDWLGEDLVFRFRFGTNDGTGGTLGWVVDDMEFMDLLAYNSEACLSSNENDNICVIAPEEGTIVDTKLVNSTTESLDNLSMTVFPNPASEVINISLDAATHQEVGLSLVSVDGQLMGERKFNLQGKHSLQLQVGQLPAGFYFVKVSTDEGVMVRKVVVE